MQEGYRSEAHRRLLDTIPDTPGNVDFRGLLLRDDSWILPGAHGASGWVYGSDPVEVACVWGDVTDAQVREALTPRPTMGLIVPEDAPEFPYLTGRRQGSCVLHRLAPDRSVPESYDLPPDVDIVIWDRVPDGALEHAPAYMQTEMKGAAVRCGLSVVRVDGLPVSFCYGHHESETWWDVSVDTIEGHRRRGLSRLSFFHRAGIYAKAGKQPAWGAMTDNEASNAMAQSLGFVPAGVVRYYFSEAASSGPGAGSGS